MANSAQRIQQELDKLKQTYVRRLSTSVADLRRLQAVLASSVQPPLADLQHIYKLSNNMAGSGTTYGYPKISQTAADLNESLKLYIDSDLESPRAVQLRREVQYKLELFQGACMDVLQPKAPVASSPATLAGKQVLIIDADEMVAEFYNHVLQEAGIAAVLASGIKAAQLTSADIVIIDGGNGLAASAAIRTVRQHHKDLPIILTFGKDTLYQLKAVAGQVDDFLAKPFNPELLLAVISNRLQRMAQ